MPANVTSLSMRGRVRVEKRHGHAKGGNATWRNYEATRARHAPPPQNNSWWVGLGPDDFAAQLHHRITDQDAARRAALKPWARVSFPD